MNERKGRMKITHEFEELTLEKRPQDPHLNGSGLQFETLEHCGEYPDTMPQAVRITDAEGRSCLYVPVTVNGGVVTASDSHWSRRLRYVRTLHPTLLVARNPRPLRPHGRRSQSAGALQHLIHEFQRIAAQYDQPFRPEAIRRLLAKELSSARSRKK